MVMNKVQAACLLVVLGTTGSSCEDPNGGVDTAEQEQASSKAAEVCHRGKQKLVSSSREAELIAQGAYRGPCDIIVNRTSLGDGYVQSYVHLADDGSPRAIGVQVDQAVLDSLPTEMNDGATCWDLNEDGTTDPDTECSGGHERILFYPKIDGLPFKFIMFNWQPHGHAPMNVFDKPHFDLHFFIQDYISRNFIRTGPCGTTTNCDDFDRAMINIPEPFFPVGFENVGGVAGRMGNHLINRSDPEFNGAPFEQAFAFGQYDGRLSYYEPVVATGWLADRPDECKSIPALPAVQLSGYYPKKYCSRYRADRGDYTMALEDFQYLSAPE
jgi:hypothetical protein